MKEDKTCKICGKTFTRRNYMQKHMEHIHSKRYSCPKCFRFFSGPTEHSCAIENGKFHCYVRDCSLRFSNGMAMRLHIRDCHRKLDEAGIGEVMKTKKGVRELVQTLCKKINLLNNCFDELKYQVDAIAEFLKSREIGFDCETPGNKKLSASKKEKEKSQISIIVPEMQSEDYENIDYIDEELEELNEDFENADALENELILDGDIECIADEAIDSNDINTLIVPTYKRSKSDSTKQTSTPASKMTVRKSADIVQMPQTTTIGSTIITQIPAKIVHHPQLIEDNTPAMSTVVAFNSTRNKRKAASTLTKSTTVDSTTPPLFLKIQYDTETTVCETDPKITFHFDTKPPDLTQEDNG